LSISHPHTHTTHTCYDTAAVEADGRTSLTDHMAALAGGSNVPSGIGAAALKPAGTPKVVASKAGSKDTGSRSQMCCSLLCARWSSPRPSFY
jgi:hypothetical protein